MQQYRIAARAKPLFSPNIERFAELILRTANIRNSQSCRANASERILKREMTALLRVSASCPRKERPHAVKKRHR